jgi:hypothetical protein
MKDPEDDESRARERTSDNRYSPLVHHTTRVPTIASVIGPR